MEETSREDWPVVKDIAKSIGLGLVAALVLFGFGAGFWGTWVACSAGVFFLVSAAEMFGEPRESRIILWLAAAGAVGGVAWWLVSETNVAMWEASLGAAGLIAVRYGIEVGITKLIGHDA